MKNNKKWGMLALIMMFWFTISFITNILGPLIPDIIHNFELKDLAMAGFIPTSFFLAYAIMSIPAGINMEKSRCCLPVSLCHLSEPSCLHVSRSIRYYWCLPLLSAWEWPCCRP